MAVIAMIWDDAAVKALPLQPGVAATMDRWAGRAVNTMKRLCPVSPVYPVYAQPVPGGASRGPVYQGRGLARPRGQARPRIRYPGDLPLQVSGHLRESIRAFRQGDGSVIVGPTASYGAYVNNGTRPHIITSTGPWPLRNRATGQVFGRVVHHPGHQPGAHFIERTAEQMGGRA